MCGLLGDERGPAASPSSGRPSAQLRNRRGGYPPGRPRRPRAAPLPSRPWLTSASHVSPSWLPPQPRCFSRASPPRALPSPITQPPIAPQTRAAGTQTPLPIRAANGGPDHALLINSFRFITNRSCREWSTRMSQIRIFLNAASPLVAASGMPPKWRIPHECAQRVCTSVFSASAIRCGRSSSAASDSAAECGRAADPGCRPCARTEAAG